MSNQPDSRRIPPEFTGPVSGGIFFAMKKYIGVLTSGGDSPGLNAAIRGVGKAAHGFFGMQVIGFRDGFRGLMENRTVPLDDTTLSGILTIGGTMLGTSRDRPERMPVGGRVLDTTDVIIENYEKNHLDVLVCLGGARHAKGRAQTQGSGPQHHHPAQDHR